MSGFVYKVKVGGQGLIKKEIPGPDTIDEFMYEINALSSLVDSDSVIDFYGLVVDDQDLHVKGLLIKYADGGALVDILYDHCKDRQVGLQWWLRKRWARQIVQGLADIHDAGFVQGDFTLSNIVIDEHDDAKIIDINRRGCPVGWEPPEATPLVESHYSITMYIGVKSDLFQLGMVLWALAMGEDEPEREGRPLTFGSDSGVPQWYQDMTNICLSPDPRKRREASRLLDFFPSDEELLQPHIEAPLAPPKLRVSVETDDHDTSADIDDDISSVPGYAYLDDDDDQDSKDRDDDDDDINDAYEIPRGRLAQSYNWWREGSLCLPASAGAIPPWHYAPRGRSPPSPLPSDDEDDDDEDGGPSKRRRHSYPAWAANRNIRPSYSDAGDNDNEIPRFDQRAQQLTPSTSKDMGPFLGGLDPEDASLDLEAAKAEITVEEDDDQDEAGPEANAVTDTAIPEEPTQENVAEGKGEDIQVPAENELQAEDVPAENKDEQSPAYPEKLEAEGHPVVEKGESDPVGSQEEPPAEAKADEATVEPETDEGHTDSKAEDTVESKAEEVSTEISTETAPPAPDSQQTQQDKTEPPADAAVPPPDNDGTSGATAEGSQATGSTIDGQDGPAEKTPGTEASSTDNNGDENSNSNTNTESPDDAAPQEPETASNGLGDLQVAPSDESNSNHHSVERVEPEQEQEQKHAEDQHEHAPDAEAEAEVGHANESSWDYSTGVAAGASAHDDATPRAPPSPPATGAASNPHQDAEGKGIEGLDHSLAGVGTMHMSINCDLLEKRGIDDDFQLIGRSEVATL